MIFLLNWIKTHLRDGNWRIKVFSKYLFKWLKIENTMLRQTSRSGGMVCSVVLWHTQSWVWTPHKCLWIHDLRVCRSKRLNYHADLCTVRNIRGESQDSLYFTHTVEKTQRQGIHPSFETQGRCHQKSKAGVSLATQKGLVSGWPRHRENREFGSYFFQTGKTQGILLQHRESFWDTGKIFLTVFINAKSMFLFTYFQKNLASLHSASFFISNYYNMNYFYQYIHCTNIFTVLCHILKSINQTYSGSFKNKLK